MRAALEPIDRRSTAVPVCIQQSRKASRPLAGAPCPENNVRNKTSGQSQRLSQLRDRLIVSTRTKQIHSQVCIDNGRERIKLNGTFALGDRFLEPAQGEEWAVSIPMVGCCVVGV